MNKLISKVVGAILGLTMAVGVGMVVGSNVNASAEKAEAAVSTYNKVTSLADGDQVLITTVKSGDNFLLPAATTSSAPSAVTVTIANDSITADLDANLFTVGVSGSQYSFANSDGKYLVTTTSNNGVRINSSTEALWTVTERTNGFEMKYDTNNRFLGIYLTQDWRSYNSATASNYGGSGQAISFFKKGAAAQTYTVSFNANGGSGTMADVSDVAGSYTLPACGFTAPSGYAFIGWKANNAGDLLAVGGSYTVSANVTFYAIYAAQRTVVYDANGGSGTMTDSNSPYGDGATVTVLDNAFTAPTGMRFQKWNTEADGSGTSYNPGATFTISANTTLYAIWEEQPDEVEITYSSYSENVPSSGYGVLDWTAGGVTGKIHSVKNTSGYIQFQANNSYVYNTQAISGYITSITITKASGDFTQLTAYVGSSALTAKPSEGGEANSTDWTWTFDSADEYIFFRIDATSKGAKYFTKIVVGYEKVTSVDPTGIALNDSTAISMDTYGYGARKLTATVSPFNANDTTVTWGTSNANVVTVDNGELTAVGVGTATVFATTANYVSDAATPNLKASVSVTVTQAAYQKATFAPTSKSALAQSDDYLVSGSASVETTGMYNTDKDLPAIQVTKDKSATFTISGYAGMQIIGIDLVMSSNADAGTGSMSMTIGSDEVLAIATTAFSNEGWNGEFSASPVALYRDITDTTVGDGEDIVFTFNGVVNSLYVHKISIRYVGNALTEWASKFLSDFECDATGATAPSVDKWDELGIEFLDIATDLQNFAKAAEANENGSVIEQAMARYDYVVAKYGSTTYDNYIGRTVTPLQNARILNNMLGSSSNIGAILIIISLLGVTTIGGYYLLRKRKEEK